jgi:hypothetical protein
MDYDEVTYEEGDDWVEKVYNEDGIKVTRYKPSWYKEPDKFKTPPLKGKARKPSFGPKDP